MKVREIIAELSKLDPEMEGVVPVGMQWHPVAGVEVAQALLDKRHGYLTKMHPRHYSSEDMQRMAFICSE